jgi:hypothetical protein
MGVCINHASLNVASSLSNAALIRPPPPVLDAYRFTQCFLRWSAHSRRRMRMKCFMAVHMAELSAKLLQWGFHCFRLHREAPDGSLHRRTAETATSMGSDDEEQAVDFFSAMAVDPDVRNRHCLLFGCWLLVAGCWLCALHFSYGRSRLTQTDCGLVLENRWDCGARTCLYTRTASRGW